MRTLIDVNRRPAALVAAVASLLVALAAVIPASAAAAGPRLRLDAQSNTTAAPGSRVQLAVAIANVGDAPTDGSQPTVFTATLPDGVTVTDPNDPETAGHFINAQLFNWGSFNISSCTAPDGSPLVGGESGLRCEFFESMSPGVPANSSSGSTFNLFVDIAPAATGLRTMRFDVSGGGAGSARTYDPVRITPAEPEFGIDAFDGLVSDENGALFTQAGGHPYEYTTFIQFNTHTDPRPIFGDRQPVEPIKDILVDLPPGLVGNPRPLEKCTAAQLMGSGEGVFKKPTCPVGSQVGKVAVHAPAREIVTLVKQHHAALYNMVPPEGSPARFGFAVMGTLVYLDAELRSDGDYGVTVGSRNSPGGLAFNGSTVTFWGVPGDPRHDPDRSCPGQPGAPGGGPSCAAGVAELVPFLRMPTRCSGPEEVTVKTASWQDPGAFGRGGFPDLSDPAWETASYTTHESPGYPANPEDPSTPWGAQRGLDGCASVPVRGSLSATPTALDTETSSGLQVHVEVPNPGIGNQAGISSSDIKGIEVSLPPGVTINPSQAEGLGVCSASRYESTALSFQPTPGRGCPSDSKIGTVSVKTPLLDETLEGQVFIAEQDDPTTAELGAENPFDSFLAIYVVIENPARGILVKLAGKIELDARTGRIVTTFDDLPQQPFSSFEFRFREGARAPLVTPPTCGRYETEAVFTPWSDPARKLRTISSFEIVHGLGGGPCPPGGIPSFNPGFGAGSTNNNAGSFSPFTMRLTRNDGEQDLTKFSSVLPPGVSAKIAGVEKCSEAAIAAAATRRGRQELAGPSCPADSQIGRTLVGAGVGSVLTDVSGSLYLAGPYNGAPLSVVSITPAVAGPFDVGTVVVREALTLDPVTAEVHVDGDRSDPIPHILKGIPLKLRELRVFVDRDKFTINPTSCDPSSVKATLFGSYLDVFDPSDDVPVKLSDRYQASNCAALGFKPSLTIKLKGGTKRGSYPGLRAVVTPRRGDANIDGATVTLPRTAFLEQAHIRTICTRVQFAADSCPQGAIYGKVTAFTPLLDEPLSGPVYLRSSNHTLPDLVFDLKGVVDIEVPGRIDSVNGGIRARFSSVPDAPISKVVLTMQGGKKGLIVNSANLCAAKGRAKAAFTGQNGKRHRFRPLVKAQCGKGRKSKRSAPKR